MFKQYYSCNTVEDWNDANVPIENDMNLISPICGESSTIELAVEMRVNDKDLLSIFN